MSRRHPNLTNIDELEWADGPAHGSRFGSKTKRLGAATGGKGLGCSLYEVQPGKRAFPFHAHVANEEAIYVLEGSGTIRIGAAEIPVRAGDYVALLRGEDHAHQLINTSSAALRYLCMSTLNAPELAFYPDSNKLGVLGGELAPLRLIVKRGQPQGMVDYFEGEKAD
jgi:uncharacterized cupin superfamily protein